MKNDGEGSEGRVIVGLCGGSWGKHGVGKTTAANILVKNMGFHPVSFVDPVKDAAKRFFGWDGTMDDAARVLLDRICRSGREISENYWRDMAIVRVPREAKRIVFDDVYFENEFRFIIGNKGMVMRIIRDGFDTPVVPCETVDVENNGGIRELQRLVLMAVNGFVGGA